MMTGDRRDALAERWSYTPSIELAAAVRERQRRFDRQFRVLCIAGLGLMLAGFIGIMGAL